MENEKKQNFGKDDVITITFSENVKMKLIKVIYENEPQKNFWIGETPITNAQWYEIYKDAEPPKEEDLIPKTDITWDKAREFCTKLNQYLECILPNFYAFDLPTKEQWQYAAMGGQHKSNFKYSGSDNLDDVGWFKENSENHTHPVRLKQPNALGIYDMSGNVCEWGFSGDKIKHPMFGGSYWREGATCSITDKDSGAFLKKESDSGDVGFRIALVPIVPSAQQSSKSSTEEEK